MTLEQMLELRMQRIAQMAEKLGIQLAPGSEAQRELHCPSSFARCLACKHEAHCSSFIANDDPALSAPKFCVNKELFDRLIAAEIASPTLSEAELDYLLLMASSISFTGDRRYADPAQEYFASLPKSAELQSLDIK